MCDICTRFLMYGMTKTPDTCISEIEIRLAPKEG